MGIFDKFRKKKVVAKKAVAADAPKAAAPSKPAARPAARKTTTRKPAAKAAAKAAADDRGQCGAITASGKQCSRRARDGSKYCGLHKGYQPPSKAKAAAAKDTKPTATGAKDTKPRGRKKADPTASKDGLRPQCAALTADGGQCKNSARASSKYCGSHKGYRPPAKAVAKTAKDTKPAVKKAKDTKPSARRTQVTKYGYKLYKNGNRYFFSKKAQADVTGSPVYTMPKDRAVVRTPNGLPVLKKK